MNKVYKIFKITSIMLLLLLLIPIVGFIILLNFQQLEFLIPIVFASVFVSTFLIPIGNLILIITFFILRALRNVFTGNNYSITIYEYMVNSHNILL